MNGISIIICCFNSATRLPETLRHIAQQSIPDKISVEVVLVNNASNDNTVEVAKSLWSKYSTEISLRIVDEKEPGQMFARIKGIQEAKYEVIIFCDDDNWLQNNYLSIAWRSMCENPNVGAIGGQGIAISDVCFPDWFEARKVSYACGKQRLQTGICTQSGFLWGAGLVTRKSILTKVFDVKQPLILSGRKGGVLIAGDDSEVCMRIVLLGHELFYNSDLIYKHYIPAARLTEEYRDKMTEGFKYPGTVLRLYLFEYLKRKNTAFILPFKLIHQLLSIILKQLKLSKSNNTININFLRITIDTIYDRNLRKHYEIIRRFGK